MTRLYYLQDTRNVVGNCALWWGKGRSGYVTDLRKAHVFNESEKRATSTRDTDKWWRKDTIDAFIDHTIDVQKLRKQP